MQRSYDDNGQTVMLKAAEPAGEVIRRESFGAAGVELRLYQFAESFTLWLVELGDEQAELTQTAQGAGADFILQGDYARRLWGEQAGQEAQGHFMRLLERLTIRYGERGVVDGLAD